MHGVHDPAAAALQQAKREELIRLRAQVTAALGEAQASRMAVSGNVEPAIARARSVTWHGAGGMAAMAAMSNLERRLADATGTLATGVGLLDTAIDSIDRAIAEAVA